jgi:hypothetical protein
MIFFKKKKLFYYLLSFNWKMTRGMGIMSIFRQNCHFLNVLVVWGEAKVQALIVRKAIRKTAGSLGAKL